MPIPPGRQYWQQQLRVLIFFLSLWLLFGLCLPILMVDWLNQFQIAGFRLGFWFAMQGSLLFFTLALFGYSWYMNRLDDQLGIREEENETLQH